MQNQKKNIIRTIRSILPLIKKHAVVITHGNGVQVGLLLEQYQETPLDVAVAETEGEIGYFLEQAIRNQLQKAHSKKQVVTVLSQVLVDKNDPSFQKPTKPIGSFLNKHALSHLRKKGFAVVEDAGRGFRRVVPSPKPLKILEKDSILDLLKEKHVVIAVGGGGIPVVQERGKFIGVKAVVDKDLASSCLARALQSDLFLILTGVNAVYLDYRGKHPMKIKKMTVKSAQHFYKQGHFPAGSMGPKILAAIDYLKTRKKGKVIITSSERVQEALRGKAGTEIVYK